MAGMAMQKSEFHRPNRTRLLTLQLYVQMRREVANTVAFRNEISERGVAARAACRERRAPDPRTWFPTQTRAVARQAVRQETQHLAEAEDTQASRISPGDE